MIFHSIFSIGRPSFSYIAIKKNGNITATIHNTAVSLPIIFLEQKYNGIPIATAVLKHTNCLLVKFNATFVFTLSKSFGTDTKGIFISLPLF